MAEEKTNDLKQLPFAKKILLVGMPNVGKSVIFNRLTGMNTSIANYAGTTVEYTIGKLPSEKYEISVIDVPGTYSLSATNEAEKVALDMLSANPDLVVLVLDANCLESSIYLALQVLELDIPVIGVLNRMDIIDSDLRGNNRQRCRCRRRCRSGCNCHFDNAAFEEVRSSKIDLKLLKKELCIPILPMVATKGRGIGELKTLIESMIAEDVYATKESSLTLKADWCRAEKICKSVTHRNDPEFASRKTRLEELIVKPFPGVFIALFALLVTFGIVIGVGMSLRRFILLPFFRGLIFPYIIYFVELIFREGFIRNVLIGEYGFVIKGIEWPITLVMPYVLSFYLALSLLEDSGYLPRLGILLDGLLNKIGLSGANVIPLILGYGCTIPAIASTRAMNSRKERLIVVSMVTLSVPCISQTGVFITLLAERSVLIVVALFILSLLAAAVGGYIANHLLKGSKRPITIAEVPVILAPDMTILGKKLWVRMKNFLTGGAVVMFYAIFATSILYEAGMFQYIGRVMEPIVVNLLKMPAEASVPLILGVIRRELSVLPLLEMDLTTLQLFTGSVVGLFYVPCIAVIAMIAKEFGAKIATLIFLLTMLVSFMIGGIIANVGGLLF